MGFPGGEVFQTPRRFTGRFSPSKPWRRARRKGFHSRRRGTDSAPTWPSYAARSSAASPKPAATPATPAAAAPASGRAAD